MSISTEIDLLITNMIIFSRLGASFPVKVAKNFKIEDKVQSCLPMFAIENQQNQSVTSGNIENRVFEKNQNGRQK